MKTPKHDSLCENSLVSVKSMIFDFFFFFFFFLRNETLLDQKLLKTPQNDSLSEKLLIFTKSMIFHSFHEIRHLLQLLAEKLL